MALMREYIRNNKCLLVAEVGLNHNGDLEIAKKLIHTAWLAGFNVVKFQKRDIKSLYSEDELAAPYESPFGTTFGDYKLKREFGAKEYQAIDTYCHALGIGWTASVWDTKSVDFLTRWYRLPYIKLPSACITDKALLKRVCATGIPIHLATGMSDLPLIHKAVNFIRDNGGSIECIYHSTSTYPAKVNELNLRAISTLKMEFPMYAVGYSGHESGVAPSVMAAVVGAQAIERHITLDRTMFGSDHAASLEPVGFQTLAKHIRTWEQARGDGTICVYDSELPIRDKLRRVNTL